MVTSAQPRKPAGIFRFRTADLERLSRGGTGHLTKKDLAATPQHLQGDGPDGRAVQVVVDDDPSRIGLAARLYRFARAATGPTVEVPESVLEEAPPDRALLAADSYGTTFRTMDVPHVLDAILENPDPKLGVFGRGLRHADGRFRSYQVVYGDKLHKRRATYDGAKAFLYVPVNEPDALAALQAAVKRDPRYARIEVRAITRTEMASHEERMKLKYDRPGVFWVSSRSPAVPHLDDTGYIVPGGRFGIELYYHDTRINLPSARSTVEELARAGQHDDAARVLSAMRGTVNSLCNEVLHYGKIFNATLTPNAGRSQAPCLTRGILETYRAWRALRPEERQDQRAWLRWASAAAQQELATVWMSEPRYDAETGLSRYFDESASVAPEEDPHFYRDLDLGPDGIQSDAAIREHGWDSMPSALLSAGPDAGQPRVHWMLPVCLNTLLYRYERDLAEIARELDGAAGEAEAAAWEARAARRKATIDALMWDDEKGLFIDVVKKPGEPASSAWRNGHEDLRSFAPLWAGMVDEGSDQARKLARRVVDFMRPGGIATATTASWERLHRLNPTYTERCQWAHKDIGWPITTYETVKGLRQIGEHALADEIAYRWCHMVQTVMDTHGGLHAGAHGGYEAPIYEKMDVSLCSPDGAAAIGYGNQGGGDDQGKGAGFRWGLDAYKLLFRELPASLQGALRASRAPEHVFALAAVA